MGSHERERNWKGGDAVLSCSVTVLIIVAVQEIIVWLANGIMLQIVLCLSFNISS